MNQNRYPIYMQAYPGETQLPYYPMNGYPPTVGHRYPVVYHQGGAFPVSAYHQQPRELQAPFYGHPRRESPIFFNPHAQEFFPSGLLHNQVSDLARMQQEMNGSDFSHHDDENNVTTAQDPLEDFFDNEGGVGGVQPQGVVVTPMNVSGILRKGNPEPENGQEDHPCEKAFGFCCLHSVPEPAAGVSYSFPMQSYAGGLGIPRVSGERQQSISDVFLYQNHVSGNENVDHRRWNKGRKDRRRSLNRADVVSNV